MNAPTVPSRSVTLCPHVKACHGIAVWHVDVASRIVFVELCCLLPLSEAIATLKKVLTRLFFMVATSARLFFCMFAFVTRFLFFILASYGISN